ncbi:unnamed protein product [Rodentolepis nana]|uniref:WD_REPEATS_REGION domain-containing protein n=1 Tax=Rodentolepis nana TaxID=102285 RepID=A0A0R3TL65_RODNA|nr:unnamed protein product [Rodentolepis nana]
MSKARADRVHRGSSRPNKRSKIFGSDDEIPSEESIIESDTDQPVDYYEEDEEIETPHEKRIRLAKLALAKSKEAIGSDDDDPMATLTVRLQEEALQARGKLFFRVADKFNSVPPESIICLLGHRKTVTCLCISSDTKYIFSGGKDASIIKWNVNDFSKTKIVRGGRKGSSSLYHTGPVLAIAISDDGKYLATGSADHSIIIWNPDTLELLFRLQRHRSPVTALSFQRQSHMMFSGDKFGRVCVWNLPLTDILQDQGAATKIEVLSICGLSSERCVSASGFGGAGICLWKVEQEVCVQYVVKNPSEYAIECVYAVNDDLYIGGSATNLAFSNDGKWLVAGIGQEHRLGRWEERRKIRDAVCLIPINIPFK